MWNILCIQTEFIEIPTTRFTPQEPMDSLFSEQVLRDEVGNRFRTGLDTEACPGITKGAHLSIHGTEGDSEEVRIHLRELWDVGSDLPWARRDLPLEFLEHSVQDIGEGEPIRDHETSPDRVVDQIHPLDQEFKLLSTQDLRLVIISEGAVHRSRRRGTEATTPPSMVAAALATAESCARGWALEASVCVDLLPSLRLTQSLLLIRILVRVFLSTGSRCFRQCLVLISDICELGHAFMEFLQSRIIDLNPWDGGDATTTTAAAAAAHQLHTMWEYKREEKILHSFPKGNPGAHRCLPAL